MKRTMAVALLALLVVLPAAAVHFDMDDARACGLYDAVEGNYALFGGLAEDGVECHFHATCATGPAHPVKWMPEGVMSYAGIVYVMLPEGMDAYGAVVSHETGSGFERVSSWALSERVLMVADDGEAFTVIVPGLYGGVTVG